MSRGTDVAEAVKDSLNGQSWTLPVVAERKYQEIVNLASADTLRLQVKPMAAPMELATRAAGAIEDVGVSLILRQNVKVSGDEVDGAQIDRLLTVIEEFVDHLRTAGKMAGASIQGVSHDPLYDEDLLLEEHLFAAEVLVTYRGGIST